MTCLPSIQISGLILKVNVKTLKEDIIYSLSNVTYSVSVKVLTEDFVTLACVKMVLLQISHGLQLNFYILTVLFSPFGSSLDVLFKRSVMDFFDFIFWTDFLQYWVLLINFPQMWELYKQSLEAGERFFEASFLLMIGLPECVLFPYICVFLGVLMSLNGKAFLQLSITSVQEQTP